MVSMNRLSTEKRAQIIGCLVEGNSIRATVRMTGAAKNTITKLLVDLGAVCAAYQDRVLVDLRARRSSVDEIWAFCYAKQKNVPDEHQGTFGYGDVWTWVAICADTKLVPSWLVGERTTEDGLDVHVRPQEPRARPIQLSTDGHQAYRGSVAVRVRAGRDRLGANPQALQEPAGRSGPLQPARVHRYESQGPPRRPRPGEISTSYVERQNLTMRMGMRRFTRLTNGFSKKVENLAHAVSLHFMHYNFGRTHQTLK